MQIIQGLLIAAALIAIAADMMRLQGEWTDNGSRKEKTENDREA